MNKKIFLSLFLSLAAAFSLEAMMSEKGEMSKEEYEKSLASRQFISSVPEVGYTWDDLGNGQIKGESESGRTIYIRKTATGYAGEYYSGPLGSAKYLTPELAKELASRAGF